MVVSLAKITRTIALMRCNEDNVSRFWDRMDGSAGATPIIDREHHHSTFFFAFSLARIESNQSLAGGADLGMFSPANPAAPILTRLPTDWYAIVFP